MGDRLHCSGACVTASLEGRQKTK